MLAFWGAALAVPWLLAAMLIDGAGGIASRWRGTARPAARRRRSYDFRVLVPIWGSVSYLLNADALACYGPRVMLCTTGDETPEFYTALEAVADAHGFRIFRDHPRRAAGSGPAPRATSGPVRDLLIREALHFVTETYVIPLDADSVPSESLSFLAGELAARGLDLASVRVIPGNGSASLLARFQELEYRLAMQIRRIAPWMLSGACCVARTRVLRAVMDRHSLFMQGNDVEAGLIASRLGYRIGHIPFDIITDVPAAFRPWLRQRLAWSGGQFRLFVINFRFAAAHPFFYFYGGVVVIGGASLRWQGLAHPGYHLAAAGAGYLTLTAWLYFHRGQARWVVFLMPLYAFAAGVILTPLGVIWYVKMARADRNWGVIRPDSAPGARQAAPRPAGWLSQRPAVAAGPPRVA